MMSSKLSMRSALDILCLCAFHVSPSLVTNPVPRISKNGSYENSVSFLYPFRLVCMTRFTSAGSATTTQCL